MPHMWRTRGWRSQNSVYRAHTHRIGPSAKRSRTRATSTSGGCVKHRVATHSMARACLAIRVFCRRSCLVVGSSICTAGRPYERMHRMLASAIQGNSMNMWTSCAFVTHIGKVRQGMTAPSSDWSGHVGPCPPCRTGRASTRMTPAEGDATPTTTLFAFLIEHWLRRHHSMLSGAIQRSFTIGVTF